MRQYKVTLILGILHMFVSLVASQGKNLTNWSITQGHIVWKLLKMSQFFLILAFSTIFVLLKLTCLVTLFDRKL